MSRRRQIAIGGIAVLAIVATADRLGRRISVIPATVTSLVEVPANNGPDHWQITARLTDGSDVLLTPQIARPDLAPGTPLCLRQISRSWAPPKYSASPKTDC